MLAGRVHVILLEGPDNVESFGCLARSALVQLSRLLVPQAGDSGIGQQYFNLCQHILIIEDPPKTCIGACVESQPLSSFRRQPENVV
jgi:hypothetical protein